MYQSVKGFLMGSLIAGTIALLYAPRSGEDTRIMIKENVLEARQKTRMAVEDAKVRLMNTATEAQQYMGTVSQDAQRKTAKLKEVGASMIEEQKNSLAHGVEEAKSAMKS